MPSNIHSASEVNTQMTGPEAGDSAALAQGGCIVNRNTNHTTEEEP
jgi:hypothetical protein